MISEPKFESVMHRLKLALKIDNDKPLAKGLGMSPSAFANRKAIHSIPYEQVIGLSKSRKMKLDWVLLGRSEPYYEASSADEGAIFNAEGATVEPGLLGVILSVVNEEFARFDDFLDHGRISALRDQISEAGQSDDKVGLKSAAEELHNILTEVTANKGMVAGKVYNQLAKYKIKPGPKQLRFLKDEAHNLVHMMSLMKKRNQTPDGSGPE